MIDTEGLCDANAEDAAVALIFEVYDTEWRMRLIDLLQNADMESFRAKLQAAEAADWEAFRARLAIANADEEQQP